MLFLLLLKVGTGIAYIKGGYSSELPEILKMPEKEA